MNRLPLFSSALLGFVCSSPLSASIQITFDTSAFSDTSGLYVTFAGNESNLIFGPDTSSEISINFTAGSLNIGGIDYGTSNAIALDDVAAYGLTLHSATSLFGFISYGSYDGIALRPSGQEPEPMSTATARYSNFEISYNGTTGGADLTNISQFGGSLKLEFLSGDTTQSYVANTLNTGDMFRALAAASTHPSPAVFTAGNQYLRVIGPNKFPASIAGVDQQSPYQAFNGYLHSLFNESGNGFHSVVTSLTNLAPGANPGGAGSAGFTSQGGADPSRVAANTLYNLDYHFDAMVEEVKAATDTDPGTYKVILTGHVNATDPNTNITYTYNDLTIRIDADDADAAHYYMTNFIYQQTIVNNPGIISVQTGGWEDLIEDFGAGTTEAALQLKVAGDFSQAMLSGFLGSTVKIDDKMIGEMTSYEFWTLASQYAYGPAQPDEEFYSKWAEAVAAHSEAYKDGEYYERLGVYGSPYDDRYEINLISPDVDTTEMRITLLADGNLTIPEPGTWALAVGLLTIGFTWIRRRRH